MVPNASTAAFTQRCGNSSAVTSPASEIASPPCSRISFATWTRPCVWGMGTRGRHHGGLKLELPSLHEAVLFAMPHLVSLGTIKVCHNHARSVLCKELGC